MKIIISVLVTLIIAILIIIIYVLIGEPDGLINSDDINIEWINFKRKYNKSYEEKNGEDERRKQLFVKAKNLIIEHNKRYAKGLESYTLGINQYADLTDHEYIGASHKDDNESSNININSINSNDDSDDYELINSFTNLTSEQKLFLSQNTLKYNYSYIDNLPDNINWIKYGYTNPVIDQGKCGSCYIFSSISTIEAHYFIKYKTLLQLSHQEILDCSSILGNTGCNGGYIEDVYNYAMLFGIGLSDQNPYLGGLSKVCNKKKPRIFVKKQFYGLNVSELSLKEVIATYGPVSSPINAGLNTFKFYKSGLYYDPECSTDNLEHAITTVGYGINENGKDYWLIKNSFGEDWGVNGYMYIARNRDNHCGIATEYIFPQF